MSCDLTRGFKQKNFLILETTAGPLGWGEFTPTPRPGEMRKIFYQHVAHRADSQFFFRWRTSLAGREQYWHGLLGHDGRPGRRLAEAAAIGEEVKRLAPALAGTTIMPQAAILYDYNSRWATDIQPSFRGNSYIASVRRYYDALLRAGVNVDVIASDADFSGYRLLLAPQLHVLPDALAEKLNDFVAAGGTLLADTRTGVKTEMNPCHARPLPGLLAASLGIEIEDSESVSQPSLIRGRNSLDGDWTAALYADWVRPRGAEVLAHHCAEHLEGFAAVTRCRFGQGTGYYVGTIVQEPEFYDRLVGDLLRSAGIRPPAAPPAGVEVSVRRGEGRTLLFLINHTAEAKAVPLSGAVRDLLTGQSHAEQILLARFDIAVCEFLP